MTPRERFFKAMNHQEPDRVLIDMGKQVGSIHKFEYIKLKEHLGNPDWMKNENVILDKMAQTVVLDEALLQKFGVDFRWLIPKWVGIKPFENDEEYGYYDMWGSKFKGVGDYYALTQEPLKKASSIEDIESYDWPDPNNLEMYEGLAAEAKHLFENTDYIVGADGIKGGILQTCLWVRGYSEFLLDLAMNPKFAEALLKKVTDLFKQMYTNYLNAVGEYVQLVYITDDLGTQSSQFMSKAMFQKLLKPHFKDLNDHIKSLADVKIMFHCDGAIDPLMEDLIETEIDIINPVQTSTKGMDDTQALKEKYGDRLCFHGAIDVQQIMPKATPAQIKYEVARRMYDLGKNGGYICATCHNIGHDIPVENITTFYEAAQEYGKYPLDNLLKIIEKGYPENESSEPISTP